MADQPTPLDFSDLAGRRALVTGGSGGIGGAIAAGLQRAGARVAITGRSDLTLQTAARLGTDERPVHPILVDLGDRAALKAAFESALNVLGGLDILVASQGIVRRADSMEHDLGAWDETIETNLTSVFELCQLAAREMAPRGYGKIVNIASMQSFSGGVNIAAYAASKGGVALLTKALANEWAPLGINVNALAPGYVKTALNRHIWRDNPERTAEILARIPVGRWAEPEDCVGPTMFLCSAAADYVHGVVLPVDGGFLAR